MVVDCVGDPGVLVGERQLVEEAGVAGAGELAVGVGWEDGVDGLDVEEGRGGGEAGEGLVGAPAPVGGGGAVAGGDGVAGDVRRQACGGRP